MKSWKKSTSQNVQREQRLPTRIGEIAKQAFPTTRAQKQEGSQAADFTYGNVWARIWKNIRRNGESYYRVSFNRIDVREGEEVLRNNFTPDDPDDLMRAARRCKIWFAKNGI